jgi:hypothetical protein
MLFAGALAMGAEGHARSESNSAKAEALFVEGRKLMDLGKFAEACPKLAESYRLEKTGGTLLNLAVCHELEGKLAAAWSEYKESVAQAQRHGNARREQIAQARLVEVEPRLAHVRLVVPLRLRVPGLVVALDGVSLDEPSWGVDIPVDPTTHEVAASVPGHGKWVESIDVRPSDGVRDVEIVLPVDSEAVAQAPAPPTSAPPAATPGATVSTPSRSTTPTEASKRSGLLISPTGAALGGIGLALVGAGTYLGLEAAAKWNTRNEHCPGGACDDTAVRASDDAKKLAIGCDVALGLGIGYLAVSTFLLVRGAHRPAPQRVVVTVPSVGRTGALVLVESPF